MKRSLKVALAAFIISPSILLTGCNDEVKQVETEQVQEETEKTAKEAQQEADELVDDVTGN